MKYFCLILLSLFVTLRGVAQSTSYCGTTEMTKKQELELKKFAAAGYPDRSTRGTYYIPIKFHLVCRNDGSGLYPIGTLLQLLCELNDKYQPIGFYFYIYGGIEIIRDSSYYNITYTTGDALMSAYNVSNVVNVYVVGDPAGNCGYYTPGNDAVAVGIGCSDVGSTTLAHELGHFFSLPHPFINYNVKGYSEYVDETNCTTAGDYFCDTRADYVDTRWACPYSGTQKDAKGKLYHPDSSLFMCYSLDNCQNRFSAEQRKAMINNLTSSRSTLDTVTYNTAAVDTVKNVSPANNSTGISTYPVRLTWNKANNAAFYLVQYCNTPAFIGNTHDTVVTDTFFLANKIFSNKNYYWRVRGFQPGNTCSGWSVHSKFKTTTLTTAVKDIESKAVLNIYPNPVTGQSFILNFAHPMGNSADATLELIDVNGRTIITENLVLIQGENTIKIPAVETGTYIVRVHSNNLYYNKLIQVTR